MINKIKDKQTGEVYEIGGSNKLKLVASGIVTETDDTNIRFELSNPIENNKFYLVKRRDQLGDEFTLATIYVHPTGSHQTSTPGIIHILNDNDGSAVIGRCIYNKLDYEEKSYIDIEAFPKNDDFFFSKTEDDYVEIYELPFALEV